MTAQAPDMVDGGAAADAAGALDLILADAAIGPIRRFVPGLEGMRFALRLARRPRKLADRGADLFREYAQIAVGTSRLAPAMGDRRFADSARAENAFLCRAAQTHLANAQLAENLLCDAHLDWRDDQRIRFVVENLIDALAPSNSPLVSPLAWKAVIDTGGISALRGLSHLVRDMASAPRVPTMVEPSAFEVGRTVAATPGSVMWRTPMFELIQYLPHTLEVRSLPLLIFPPVINKYYVIDMAPGRSLIEYLLSEGQQVFVMSWRNPDARHRQWGLDTYGQAILDAIDAVLHVCAVEQTNLLARCSGGIMASMVAAHLAETGRLDRLATLSLGVTVLDQSRAGVTAPCSTRRWPRLLSPHRRVAGSWTAGHWPRYSPGCGPMTLSGTIGCCGLGAGFEALKAFVDALDPTIEVICFDVPGVGGSPAGPVPYGFPGIAYLAARMMKRLGYSEFDVLGLSWGGALAQQLALQHYRRVRRLVLVSTGTGAVMVPGRPPVLIKLVTPRRYHDRRHAARIVGSLYGGRARQNPGRILSIMGDSMRTGTTIGYIHQLLATVGWNSLPWLRFIRQPTLILAGNDDPIVPLANAYILRLLLPHAELHVYSGGHVALVTEADLLAPMVASFLTKALASHRRAKAEPRSRDTSCHGVGMTKTYRSHYNVSFAL